MSDGLVQLEQITPAIVQVTMADRVHKNGFSTGLAQALIRAFETVRSNPAWKVMVLTGYDTYFCTGGTQEMLLELADGRGQFTDYPIYELPLTCEIPVVAAMQGHAIGGGLVFGLFADLVVFSRESVYAANFMRYGFTPGFGSTLVLQEKLGLALAQELLMTAENYRGDELAGRGIPFPVLPRASVLARAHELAVQLAEKPRHSLVTLKAHLTSDLRARLPAITAREVQMHAQTFHHPEVRERIKALFGN
ncbi:TPA: polyketide synthase [Pseudomonas aeruginosa]|uniref:polyketide synthase n=1 Tax=Pseudomonas aeruginosa TaxID=287 RepID=UPI000937A7E7|nr:polyketide synthase [Pseudomonas aeruginosa]EIU2706471.1 enoyl-CoA hydratase/isomerase family protein [Pseudomonas aeruginosa]ELD6249156.1 enoyl-CoA hydratase/isomerase family protein [Pseudomonas aeruginosa]ELH1109315.1 enoyl-CoA hydratase/isomerase family protein [Pseudomonas aeruginosa]ELU0706696.1 enoyl-CoA hydratase/isomerase family protein [Pseudomonas aeruginosa]MBG6355776.1 enoyl-CoA hydratase/isomerase family protein [Pseudomonas aeruginosa]